MHERIRAAWVPFMEWLHINPAVSIKLIFEVIFGVRDMVYKCIVAYDYHSNSYCIFMCS